MGNNQSSIKVQIGERINSCSSQWYVIERELGEGHFGKVSLCHVRETGEKFALKVVKKEEINRSRFKDFNKMIEYCEKIHLEHENIIDCYYKEDVGPEFLIYMEYAEYGSVAQMYRQFGALIDHQVGWYILGTLKGLSYLHDLKIMHRDIKCDNILLTSYNTVKLCDFGLASQMKEKTEYMSTNCGTLHFKAPEVEAGQKYSFAADIWSVGATALEMKVGGKPSQIDGRIMAELCPIEFYRLNCEYSQIVFDFLEACLRTNPRERPTLDFLIDMPLCKSTQLSEEDLLALMTDLNDCSEIVKNLKSYYFVWRKARIEIIHIMCEIAEELDQIRYQTNACNVAGSTGGAVGGILAVVGIILAPVTLGGSLAVTGVGIGLGVAGGAVTIGGSTAEMIKIKKKKEHIEFITKKENDQLNLLIDILNQLFHKIKDTNLLNRVIYFLHRANGQATTTQLDRQLGENRGNLKVAHLCANTILSPCKAGIGTFITCFESLASTTASMGAKVGARVTSGVLNGFGLIIDVYFLVKASVEMAKGSPSKAAENLRNEAIKLKEFFAQMETIYESLIGCQNEFSSTDAPLLISARESPDNSGSNYFEQLLETIDAANSQTTGSTFTARSENICRNCRAGNRNCVITPCGHFICENCAEIPGECPTCSVEIISIDRIQ